MLTGKCRKAFLKWLPNNLKYEPSTVSLVNWFYYPLSMQFGVYQDFFESVNIYVDVDNVIIGWNKKEVEFKPSFILKSGLSFGEHHKTRPEARKQAILKANEILNKQLNHD